MSGSEIEMLASVVIPVAAAEALLPCRRRSIIALAAIHIAQLMQSAPISKKMARGMCKAMKLCSTLFDECFGSGNCTFKKHVWYGHACDDLLSTGNPAEFSSAMFESEYRLMKIGVHVGNTRAPTKTAFTLHCFRLMAAEELKCRVSNGESDLQDSLNSLLDARTTPSSIGLKSPVQAENAEEFRLPQGVECTSFYLRYARGRLCISSATRQQPRMSQQTEVLVCHENKFYPAQALLFGAQGSEVFVVVRFYDSSSPYGEILSTIRSMRLYSYAKLLSWIKKTNASFFKINRDVFSGIAVKPISSVISGGVVLDFPLTVDGNGGGPSAASRRTQRNRAARAGTGVVCYWNAISSRFLPDLVRNA